jgi:hypothetical protein
MEQIGGGTVGEGSDGGEEEGREKPLLPIDDSE